MKGLDMPYEEYEDFFWHHKAEDKWAWLWYSTVDALTILE